MVKTTCLYLKHWIQNGILYVRDLIKNNGVTMNDIEIANCTNDKRNIVKDIFIIKNYVLKRIKNLDMSIAPFVKIKPMTHVLHENKLYMIKGSKSKLYYQMLMSKCFSKGHMESVYAKEFSFENHISFWRKIYSQKIVSIKIPKLSEFNYKILHNIVPCGKVLSKWKQHISEKCQYCGEIETTKHMLYECKRIYDIWEMVSSILKIDISWKHIVCGFPNYSTCDNILGINYIIGILVYGIFRQNSYCKFNDINYRNANITVKLRSNFKWYVTILENVDSAVCKTAIFKHFCSQFTA